MQSTQETRKQAVSPVAVGLVLLVSAGMAGWVTYRYVLNSGATPQARAPVQVDGLSMPSAKTTQPARLRAPAASRAARSTLRSYGLVSRKPASGIIVARGGDAQLRAMPSDDRKDYSLALDYLNRQTWVTPKQWEYHVLAERAVSITNLAQTMKLMDAQKQELQALADQPTLSTAEQAELKLLIREWESTDRANRDGAVQKLSSAVARLGEVHRESTKTALQRRVARIPQILSSEQIKAAEEYMGKNTVTVQG